MWRIKLVPLRVTLLGVVFLLMVGSASAPAAAGGFFEVDRLLASDRTNDDEFGTDVAVSGQTLVVGTPQGDNGGAAYVFELQPDGTWAEDVKLKGGSPNSLKDFGASVAIDGDTIVVGDTNGDGEAWVFERDMAGVWQRTALPTPQAGDGFGFSVGVHGDTIVIGSPSTSLPPASDSPTRNGGPDPGDLAGAVFVFERDGSGVWQEVAMLVDPVGDNTEDNLGKAVTVGPDLIAAGGPHTNATFFDISAVLIWRRDGSGQWLLEERLESPIQDTGFGSALAISNERILIGNLGPIFGDDLAHVYEQDQFGDWVGTELLPSGPESFFGNEVALLGDRAAVGGIDGNLGIAYAFERDGNGAWIETDLLEASDGLDSEDFGEALALGTGVLFVGARKDDEAPFEDTGSVYVFEGGLPPVSLSIAGSCPGTTTLTIQTAEPNQDVVVFFGRDLGTTTVTGGGCAGTELDLEPARIFRTVTTDANGIATLTTALQDRWCGRYLQGLDRMCSTSDPLQIP